MGRPVLAEFARTAEGEPEDVYPTAIPRMTTVPVNPVDVEYQAPLRHGMSPFQYNATWNDLFDLPP
jgi:hypothetical protein